MAGRYADALMDAIVEGMRPDPKPPKPPHRPKRSVAFAPLPPRRPRSTLIRAARGGRRAYRAIKAWHFKGANLYRCIDHGILCTSQCAFVFERKYLEDIRPTPFRSVLEVLANISDTRQKRLAMRLVKEKILRKYFK